MAQPNIELILARSLAAHLAVPAFLSDSDGRIVYFNEAAELLIGSTYEETPELSSEDLLELLKPRNRSGGRLTMDEMALPRALHTRMPAHMHALSGDDGEVRYLANAFPLLDRDGLVLGALLLWYEEKA